MQMTVSLLKSPTLAWVPTTACVYHIELGTCVATSGAGELSNTRSKMGHGTPTCSISMMMSKLLPMIVTSNIIQQSSLSEMNARVRNVARAHYHMINAILYLQPCMHLPGHQSALSIQVKR